jgi:hypothetical protein
MSTILNEILFLIILSIIGNEEGGSQDIYEKSFLHFHPFTLEFPIAL